ncbi:hypothetical protein [Mucilaginibacter sp. L3T2-6]|uniref:hypothetical protein n=1 Tax=Mucilaginibacter sp. L3T2-6 TaxID=3062491 RepID=UPI002674B7D2|nr:hypothetical protein [Mucilaginibacter sp. L3T2-6]MDO3641237.1 hypothetical protein [Mucilaginibacter sp. L3T2-6]MDV6214004.1 hypothetical protein [Mucilaginibacter sp. L3T2-6]
MKKYLLIFSLTSLLPGQSRAQGTGGFFNQQASKVKIMLTQIAGYETYLHAIKSGYGIVNNGLNTANAMKGGTFGLHTAYFNSLQQVNPVIANNPKGKAISDLCWQINRLFAAELSRQQQQKVLSGDEIGYIQNVYQSLDKKCQADMDELLQVLTPGKLQLTDHQRLERLDHLYAAMQDKQAFAASFTAKCRKLATDRQHARQQNDQLKKLYGIQ